MSNKYNRLLKRLKKKIEQLTRIKGVGLLSAATLVAETNGFTGFENIRQSVLLDMMS